MIHTINSAGWLCNHSEFRLNAKNLGLDIHLNPTSTVLFINETLTGYTTIVVIGNDTKPIIILSADVKDEHQGLIHNWMLKYYYYSHLLPVVIRPTPDENIEDAFCKINTPCRDETRYFVHYFAEQTDIIGKIEQLGYVVKVNLIPKFVMDNGYSKIGFRILRGNEFVLDVWEDYTGMFSKAVIYTRGRTPEKALQEMMKKLVREYKEDVLEKDSFPSEVFFDEQW